MAIRGSKPGERRGGRQKGARNKVPGSVREMVLAALDQAGGVRYLLKQADKNPTSFMALVAKCMPAVVEATVEQHTTITIQERRQKALELIEAAFGNRAPTQQETRH